MNVYESIVLTDCWPYKDNTEFKIPKGLSTIYGLNRVNKSSKNANGAGKSFLMGQIHEIQYNLPSLGTTQDRVKRGQRTLKVTNYQNKNIEITVKGNRPHLMCDGKMVAKGSKPVKAAIAKYIPITMDEFNTYVYFDSRVGHPLVMGSSQERKRFFTSFFQLDKLDKERKIFNAYLSELKAYRQSYKEVKAQYKELKAELSKYKSADELEKRIQKVKERLDILTVKQDKLRDQQRQQVFLESTKDQRAILDKLLAERALTEDLFEDLYKSVKEQINRIEDQISKQQIYQKQLRLLAEYKKAMRIVDKKHLSMLDRYGLDKLKIGYKKYELNQEALQSAKRKLTKFMRTEPESVKKPKTDKSIGSLLEQKSRIEHRIKHQAKFGTGNCPTCGQSVDLDDPDKLQSELTAVARLIKQKRAYDDFRVEQQAFMEEQKQAKKIRAELDDLEAKRERYKPYSDAYRAVRDLPDKPDVDKVEEIDIDKLRSKLEASRKQHNALQFLKPNIHLLLQKPSKAITEDFSSEIRQLSEKLARYQSQLELSSIANKKFKSVKKRLTELDELLADEEDLTVLIEGYNDKQIKRMVIRQISQLLMKQVNKYARSVFSENYHFELKWESQIELLVNRKYGKRVETSDVRKLSGAEYKLFSLVLVMALLSFVPKKKRSSVLILDEPSANMHTETRQAFISFLDVMKRVIPSIIVITPKTDEVYPNSKMFTVVKENGYSTIRRGHPNELV